MRRSSADAAAKRITAGRVFPSIRRGSGLAIPRMLFCQGEAPGREKNAVSSSPAAAGPAPLRSLPIRSTIATLESVPGKVVAGKIGGPEIGPPGVVEPPRHDSHDREDHASMMHDDLPAKDVGPAAEVPRPGGVAEPRHPSRPGPP